MTDARADFEALTHAAVHTHFEQSYPDRVQGPRGAQRIVLFGASRITEPPVLRWFPHWEFHCPSALEEP